MNNPFLVNLVDVFAVYETIDDRGRRGILVGVYANPHDAKHAARGRGYYGSDGAVEPRKGLLDRGGTLHLLDRVDPSVALGRTRTERTP